MAILRLARADDLPAVRALVAAAYARYLPRMGRPAGPVTDDYAAHQSVDALQVLEEDGRIVGVLVLIERDDALLLDNVAVAPDAQGRGHGKVLIAAAEATARARGYRRITLYTHATMTENRALYARTGWRETGRRREKGFDRVYFEKDLI